MFHISNLKEYIAEDEIYQKYKKCWILDNKIINIEEYNPVSTISESGE